MAIYCFQNIRNKILIQESYVNESRPKNWTVCQRKIKTHAASYVSLPYIVAHLHFLAGPKLAKEAVLTVKIVPRTDFARKCGSWGARQTTNF